MFAGHLLFLVPPSMLCTHIEEQTWHCFQKFSTSLQWITLKLSIQDKVEKKLNLPPEFLDGCNTYWFFFFPMSLWPISWPWPHVFSQIFTPCDQHGRPSLRRPIWNWHLGGKSLFIPKTIQNTQTHLVDTTRDHFILTFRNLASYIWDGRKITL